MNHRLLGAALLAAVVGLSSGCAVNKTSANLVAGADLSKVHTVYVVKAADDDREIDKLIVTNLTKRGFAATSGTQAATPSDADASVTYVDKWMWDLTMYMIQLQVTMRDKSSFPMANATSLHTSLTRKSPPEMVDEVVGNLLTAK